MHLLGSWETATSSSTIRRLKIIRRTSTFYSRLQRLPMQISSFTKSLGKETSRMNSTNSSINTFQNLCPNEISTFLPLAIKVQIILSWLGNRHTHTPSTCLNKQTWWFLIVDLRMATCEGLSRWATSSTTCGSRTMWIPRATLSGSTSRSSTGTPRVSTPFDYLLILFIEQKI